MDTTIVSAMVGVLGSLVGASTAIATGWLTQKTQETLKKQGQPKPFSSTRKTS